MISAFLIPKMDCSAEEQLVRMKLQPLSSVHGMQFDLKKRVVMIDHDGNERQLLALLGELNLGVVTKQVSTDEYKGDAAAPAKKLLIAVFAINFSFFIIEGAYGLGSGSMGLVADSLDMMADAIVYALALLAMAGPAIRKQQVARVSGILQLALAGGGLAETVRRFLHPELPDYTIMIVVSLLALCANAVSLNLLGRTRSNEAHIRASMIFTSNDVIVNIGVILSAGLVHWLGSPLPDLFAGVIVFILVIRGAVRILRLK